MSRLPLLNEEVLETHVFKRSMKWSSHMKNWVTMDEGQELDVSDLEEMFKDEGEDPELEGDEVEEEATEDPVPETKLDMGNINSSMGVAELTLILCAGEDDEAKAEMQEILNQTMPVVQEHKRKWKEAGLDRILDTFDEKQIEQHVGRWMRRNNSVYLEEAPPAKCLYLCDHAASNSDGSDNESLHSIDTARYIRQSRRCVPNKISNTATIKMYRTHSHKRDELRAKYAYDDEQEHHHHMQTLLHRRREKERQVAYVTATPQRCIHSSGHHTRRKHLRKRRANSSLFDSSSSDEDDRSYGRCDCRSCLRHHSLSRSASYQYCSYRAARNYHHRHQHAAASRTMHTLRRQHSYDIDLDLRPRVRENECNCCKSDRLCSNVVHIANSSTEEWIVENCSSSPLFVKTPRKTPKQQKHQLVGIRKTNSKSILSKCHKQRLPKLVKASSAASKLVKSKVNGKHPLGESSEDEYEVSPRKPLLVACSERKKHPVASTPGTARKTLKQKAMTAAPAVSSKGKKLPTKQNEGHTAPKITPLDIDIVSEESEDEVKGRSHLVSFSVAKDSVAKKPSSTKKQPTSRALNRLSKISEEVPKLEEPEDNNTTDQEPASSTKICMDKDIPSLKKTSSKALESNSNQVLDEPKANNKSKESGHVVVTNAAGTTSKPQGAANIKTDSSKKVAAASNKVLSVPKITPADIQSSDETESETEPKGRSRLVSFSVAKGIKKASSCIPKKPPSPQTLETNSNQIRVASSPKETATSKKTRGRPTQKSDSNKMTAASDLQKAKPKAKVATQSSEPVDEKVKAPKASNQKTKKGKPRDSASLDKKTNSDDELERALALSKVTYKNEKLKRAKDPVTTPEENQSHTQSLPMFNNNSVACNSTALVNDTACTRVLSPKKRVLKRIAAVSSTEPAQIISLSSSCESLEGKDKPPKGGDADCTVVTSTTICEPPPAAAAAAEATPKPQPLPPKIGKQGILLHSSSSAGGEANFTLTEQSLSEVIGERYARKYLKYHMGSLTFDSSHSVYYRPTPKLADALRAASMDTQSLANLSSSSSSDDDVFDRIQKYGNVFSVAEDAVRTKN